MVDRHVAKLRMKGKEKYMSKGNSTTDVSQGEISIFGIFNCIDVVVQVWRLNMSFYEKGIRVNRAKVF